MNADIETLITSYFNAIKESKFFGHVMLRGNFSTYEGTYDTKELIKFWQDKSISVRFVVR